MDSHYNPFQNSQLLIPEQHREDVQAFTRTRASADGSSSTVDESPFDRYVDLWFVALCIGVSRGLRIEPTAQWHKFVTGQVLQGDIDRIALMELVAMAHTGDPFVVKSPKDVIDVCNGYAGGGLPDLLASLRETGMKPLDGFLAAMGEIAEEAGLE